MSYVYIKSEPGLWTVGFYKPDGAWESESDHDVPGLAAKRVHWLNGGRAEPANVQSSTATPMSKVATQYKNAMEIAAEWKDWIPYPDSSDAEWDRYNLAVALSARATPTERRGHPTGEDGETRPFGE